MASLLVRVCQGAIVWVIVVVVTLLVSQDNRLGAGAGLLAAVAGVMWILVGGLRGRLRDAPQPDPSASTSKPA